MTVASDDRRFFVLGTSRDHANDQEYFKPIATLVMDESIDIALLFYRWLMSSDLEDSEVRRFPKSKVRLRMQIEARDPFFEWLQEMCIQPHPLLIRAQCACGAGGVLLDIYTAYSEWYSQEMRGRGSRG